MSILIKNASYVVTQDKKRQILKDADILIENQTIEKIGKNLKEKTEFVVDGKNKIILPGLINLHTHAAMTLFRGFADDMNLHEWLMKKIFPLENKLKEKDIFWGSMLSNIEMIKSGTTSFFDMYFFLDEIAKAVQNTGIRGFLSPTILDKPTLWVKDRLAFTESFIKKWKNKPRIYPSPGPHSIYLCSAETLQKSDEISKKYSTVLNIHLSETKKEVNDSIKKFGKSPVIYLEKLGILSSRMVAAHSVWISEKEMKILTKHKVNVAHCPISNMKLASGLAPVYQMFKAGINVGLGTDSVASNNNLNLFEEMKISILLQKMKYSNAKVMTSQQALDMATINGARALGMESKLGSIEKGKFADLFAVDLTKPHFHPIHDIISNLVYSASGSDVVDTIIDGQLVMENRNMKTVDEMKTIQKFESQVNDLFNRN
jgi:5-methylthioadenosine/S-adenosylhomocysteine deaminase